MRWRTWASRYWPVAGLAAFSFVAALAVRHWYLPLGSGDADEGAYAHLAELLRHGHVTMSLADYDPFFHPWLTGVANGHFYFQYQPGWPAVLALSQAVFHSKPIGVALCAAALTVAVYALAHELLSSRRTSVISAAIVALSPLFLLHSSLYLSYLFTTLLATLTLTGALRALRTGRWVWAVAVGALLGLMILTRPFDGFLTGVIVVVTALVLSRESVRRLSRLSGFVVVGVLPFLAIAAAFNARTTGSIFSFPLSASDSRNRFGFGDRALQIGTSPLHYDLSEAWESFTDNGRAAFGWIFGGFVTFAVALWSVTRRPRRRERLVLLFAVLLFPVAYFFWWATSLAAEGATNGLGPHYWVPSFVFLAILAGDGFAWLSRRHAALVSGLAVVALVATAYNVPDKIDDAKVATDIYSEIDRALPHDLDNAIVFIASDEPEDFTGIRYPFLIGDPGTGSPVLYPVDRHGENGLLIAAHPERRSYLLHRQSEPGGDFLHPPLVLTPLEARSGAAVPLAVQLSAPYGAPVRGYASAEDRSIDLSMGDASVIVAGPDRSGPKPNTLNVPPGPHDVTVGVERTDNGERWERVYRVFVADDGTVTVVTPGVARHVVDFGKGAVDLKEDVSNVIADRT